MKNLEKPLTKEEEKKLRALLNSDRLFSEMLEKAVRGRRRYERRARNPSRDS